MQWSLAQTRAEIELTRVIIVTVGITGRKAPKLVDLPAQCPRWRLSALKALSRQRLARHFVPLRDHVLAVRQVAQMRRRRRGDAGLGRRRRLLPRADALNPVRQVQKLAVGLVVEVG